MTNQQHPITPPPELINKWASSMCGYYEAARWGADQELEACIAWVAIESFEAAKELRAARRPKPPSLKEQALETVQRLSKNGFPCNYQDDADWDTIRRALEQLDD